MSPFEFIFGKFGGMTKKELNRLTRRHKFSEYLPYVAYDPETRVYLNSDNTAGFIWECSPLCFAGSKTITTLEGMFRIGFPEKTILQFSLFADDHIEPFVSSHLSMVKRDSIIAREAVNAYTGFILEGTRGVEGLNGIPLRNFRLFVSVKMPVDGIKDGNIRDIEHNINEILQGAFLYPRPFAPQRLLDMMRRFFNDKASLNNDFYDEDLPIKNQIILSETGIASSMSNMKVGEKYFKCLTPKVFPLEVTPMQTNQIFGGIDGIISDAEQYKTPFLYTLNIMFHELKTKIHTKCNLVLQQQAAGSFAPSLMRKKDEYLWATDAIEKGTRFVRVMPVLWMWSPDEKEAIEAGMRAKRVWESQGYVMQEDKGILTPLFISSLPFGLYDAGGNIESLERDFIVPVDSVACILPVQADFSGGGNPILSFTGRKGQMCGMDVFAKEANNHNIFVTATTGSGKSFMVNYLVSKYYAANAMIRIIDIGGSYKKMNKIYGAKYLDFSDKSDICLNPFTNIKEDEIKNEVSAIAAIILQMVYSATDRVPVETAETAMSLIKAAVKWAYRTKGNEASIDTVYEYLNAFPKYAEEYDFDCADKKDCAAAFQTLAQTIAFNLSEFTTGHTYGKWFNGKANLDISHDEFVVLELEHLKPQKELFKVVTLQVINEITRDLYLSDRSRPRFIIFDEAWQFIKESKDSGSMHSTPLAEIIEEGYRRARKYSGSFSIITQSLLDLKAFGRVGDVIRGNSDFKFYLESVDFDKALNEKLIDYDEFTMRMLKSLKSNKPKYSEIFMDTPFGVGVARLIVDPYSYFVYTSDPREISEIEQLVDAGMTYEGAIEEMIKRHRPEYYRKNYEQQKARDAA